MIDQTYVQAKERMQKSLETLQQNLIKIRTGRAQTSLLEHVMVPYYGNNTPLMQVANIVVEDSRTLIVTPWEKDMITVVDKAIRTLDFGLNPVTAGMVIRVPLPPLTEERRKSLVKNVRTEAESARVAVRNIRRDANQKIKDLLKAKMISEDEEHHGEDRVQKLTDEHIKKVDVLIEKKEADLMKV